MYSKLSTARSPERNNYICGGTCTSSPTTWNSERRGIITLEDETGTANIIIWKNIFKQYRRAIIESRLLRVTGTIQHQGDVSHIIAKHLEDISYMLDEVLN